MRLILLPLALAAILSVCGSEEERTFPTGTCEYPDFDSPLSLKVYDGPTCHRLCNHHNLTSSPGTYPDVQLDCIYNSSTQDHTCEDAKFITFSECQQSSPALGSYDRNQCVCTGGEDDIVVCDSDYYKDKPINEGSLVGRRPPLECESVNITSLESCIDVATYGGRDFYCNHSSTPCELKYRKVGDYMMCTSKWRQGNPTVICGDACAWDSSEGTQKSGFGAVGLVLSIGSAGAVLLV